MEDVLRWAWRDRPVETGMTRIGAGPLVVMLPALSSISTRAEMRGLQERLGQEYSTVAVDWPGFGDRPRPAVAWQPDAYRAFLRHLLKQVLPGPKATIAAGHGAGYLLQHAADEPHSAGKLCLIAPTWRGPLPSMANRRHPLFRWLSQAVDIPGFGALLYRLNVNRPMIGMMTRGHVYDDPSWLGGERLTAALKVTQAPGARHAAFRFVAGELDPMRSRAGMLAAARRVADPTFILYGAHTPPKSKAEIEALIAEGFTDGRLASRMLNFGKLAIHDEYPDDAAEAIMRFLRDDPME